MLLPTRWLSGVQLSCLLTVPCCQVSLIVKHEKFVPLSSPGGDGRNDIALLYIRTRGGRGISFDEFVTPACLPSPDTKIKKYVV